MTSKEKFDWKAEDFVKQEPKPMPVSARVPPDVKRKIKEKKINLGLLITKVVRSLK